MSKSKESGIGLAGGVVGIVNVSLSFILSWFLAPLFVATSIVVVALSAIGLKKARAEGTSLGWSVTGLATGIPTLVWNASWSAVLLAALLAGW